AGALGEVDLAVDVQLGRDDLPVLVDDRGVAGRADAAVRVVGRQAVAGAAVGLAGRRRAPDRVGVGAGRVGQDRAVAVDVAAALRRRVVARLGGARGAGRRQRRGRAQLHLGGRRVQLAAGQEDVPGVGVGARDHVALLAAVALAERRGRARASGDGARAGGAQVVRVRALGRDRAVAGRAVRRTFGV